MLCTAGCAPAWRAAAPSADFFAAKALLAAVLDTLRVAWTLEPEQRPFLHPGRSATVLAGGERVGFLGELHPLVTRAWGLERTTRDVRDRHRQGRRGRAGA